MKKIIALMLAVVGLMAVECRTELGGAPFNIHVEKQGEKYIVNKGSSFWIASDCKDMANGDRICIMDDGELFVIEEADIVSVYNSNGQLRFHCNGTVK
jgi:hypothetical protein